MVKIAHASIDERGKISGGQAGDQTGKELCIRSWYSRPWSCVIRFKDPAKRKLVVEFMISAVKNKFIGYNQNRRNTLLTRARKVGYDPKKVTDPCETDCSALQTLACIYAGIPEKDLVKNGNSATTSTLKNLLVATGEVEVFTGADYTMQPDKLIEGDILLSEGHHVATVVETEEDSMVVKSDVNEFIEKVSVIAVAQAKKHGNKLFPSITIAQAAQESGWGTTKRMVDANALYGVKVGKSAYKFGTAWKGAAYKTGTKEYYDGKNPTKIVDYFRAYDNITDATEDYMDMLCHCERYKGALNCKTPEESIKAIKAGGYATGPDYVSHIMSIVKKYDLTKFDKVDGSLPVVKTSETEKKKSPYIVGKVYTLRTNLYVRKTPNGTKVKYNELTEDGKKKGQQTKEGDAVLLAGTRVTCKEYDGNWIRIPSGWICAKTKEGTPYIL